MDRIAPHVRIILSYIGTPWLVLVVVEGGSDSEDGRGHGRPVRVLAPAFAGFWESGCRHENSEIILYIGTRWLVLVVVEGGSEGVRGHERPCGCLHLLSRAFAKAAGAAKTAKFPP